MHKNKWIWPLPGIEKKIPEYTHQGGFGVKRAFDTHTGVDIYCENNQPVVACEDGEVIEIENFTGKSATPSTPWWNDTYAVIIKGESGHILYGEILISNLYIGKKIKAGDLIGTVTTVLKKNKGLPMNMLHLELYNENFKESVVWNFGENQPNTLLDPTEFLKKSASSLLETISG